MTYPPNITQHLALVLDGVVLDIMHMPDRLGAILLSNPTIVSVEVDTPLSPQVGWNYSEDTGFTPPA